MSSNDNTVFAVEKKKNFFDVGKSINTRTYAHDIDNSQKWDVNEYMLNTLFSMTPDSLIVANEANKFTINDSKMLYDFYYHLLPFNPRRYGKWHKSSKDEHNEIVEKIMQVYCYSREKAVQCLDIFLGNDEALEFLNSETDEGGKTTARKSKAKKES